MEQALTDKTMQLWVRRALSFVCVCVFLQMKNGAFAF